MITLSLPGWATVLLGLVAIGGPLFAWAVALLLVGPGHGARSRRAAIALGWAVPALLGWAVLARLLGLVTGFGADPAAWAASFATWVNANFPVAPALVTAATAASGAIPGAPAPVALTPVALSLAKAVPADLVFPLAALDGALVVPFAALAAWRLRGDTARPAFRIPLAGPAGIVVAVAALLTLFGLDHAYAVGQVQPATRVLLDAAALLPAAMACLAIWTLAGRDAPQAAAPEAEIEATRPDRVDVPALWRERGALDPAAGPLMEIPAERGTGGPTFAADAWRHVGAVGAPPLALEQIARLADKPGQGWLVGDLPDPTEATFLAASILLAAQGAGIPCLVVTEQPRALRDVVATALVGSGAWSGGPLVVGEEELRLALGQRRMPAVAFLDTNELSSRGIRALWNSTVGDGVPWARTVGLVVLSQVDRGSPLVATHRFFTLRRLALALGAAGARFSVLATGLGGPGTIGLVERLFPPIRVSAVPFAPRASAAVKVWPAAERFVAKPGDPWPRRAAEPLAQRALAVAVGDPTGAFDAGVQVWGADVRLHRGATLGGDASISQLDETWLVGAWRTLPNRLPLAHGGTHHALWAWPTSPITRLLTGPDHLRATAAQGRLPAPRPLVGYANPHLARTHLVAALREGRQDIDSLAGLFGRSLTDQYAHPTAEADAFVLRRTPSREGLWRVALAPAQTGDLDGTLRDTVTEDVVELRDRDGGRLLGRCDRAVVETRYYPKRVFADGDQRYEVPLHAFDAKRGRLDVIRVAPDRPVTTAALDVTVRDAVVVEDPHTVRQDRRVYILAAFDVDVRETVSGSRAGEGSLDYAPVTSRYRTRARGIFFPQPASLPARRHLAACLDHVLLVHLLAGDDDVHVIPVEAGLSAQLPAGIVAVDRYVGGMGMAEALDADVVENALIWVRRLLQGCPCDHGCPRCTPETVLAQGPDKGGVLRLLGA
ncbi:MAG: DUF1998 domain-containing protein [Pseudomonadota bacterium]|nr:DUF1998 domain-containing protein [Pseudomonadota bacterium]